MCRKVFFICLLLFSLLGVQAQKVQVYECIDSHYDGKEFTSDLGHKRYYTIKKDKCVEWALNDDGTYDDPDSYELIEVRVDGTRVYQYRQTDEGCGVTFITTIEVSSDKSRIRRVMGSDTISKQGISIYRKTNK